MQLIYLQTYLKYIQIKRTSFYIKFWIVCFNENRFPNS